MLKSSSAELVKEKEKEGNDLWWLANRTQWAAEGGEINEAVLDQFASLICTAHWNVFLYLLPVAFGEWPSLVADPLWSLWWAEKQALEILSRLHHAFLFCRDTEALLMLTWCCGSLPHICSHNLSLVGGMMDHGNDIFTLIPRNCERVQLHGKGELRFQMVLRLLINRF